MISRLRQVVSRLRLEPYDTNTAEGRENERYRLATWSALANYLSTGISMLVLIISVPLTLPYLGDERFGIWVTVASFASLLSFLDLGIGNSLINRVSDAFGSQDTLRLRFTVTHGLLVMFTVGGVVGVLLIALVALCNVEAVFKVADATLAADMRYTLLTFSILFSASIPLLGIQKIFQGLQRAWWPYIARACGGLLSIIGLFVCAAYELGPPILLFVSYGVPLIFLSALLVLLAREHLLSVSALCIGDFRAETISLLRTGGLFFVLQVGVMVGWGADSLLISTFVGVTSVTQYVLVQRALQFVTVPLAILNAPLWPAYAEAKQRGDRPYIVNTLRRSLSFTLCGALLGGGAILVVTPWLFSFWTKDSVVIPVQFVGIFALWAVMEAAGNAFAMFLNGVQVIREQVYTVICFCLIAVPLKIYLVHVVGIVGVLYASILSYSLAVVIPYSLFYRRRISNSLVTA